MRRILTFATLALALAAAASAQTAGRITGTIKDPDGKPIKGATVRATNDAVNARITSTTDDKGRFAMIGVRTGRWVDRHRGAELPPPAGGRRRELG